MNKIRIQLFALSLVFLGFLMSASAADNGQKIVPILSTLLLSSKPVLAEQDLVLTLMIAQGTDTIKMAWVPGSDGKTPAEQIQYKIYLSTDQNFVPGAASLKKTVTGESQTDITGLSANTLYFARVVAEYVDSVSEPTETQQTRTYQYPVQMNGSAVYNEAADLGLGKHTTTDGVVYTYSGGTPPPAGSILFSEDVNGGLTMRTVDSASDSGGTVTVQTSAATLTEVVDRGAISSSFRLFDVSAQAAGTTQNSSNATLATQSTLNSGSKVSRMEWKNNLLTVEQTDYAYAEDNFTLQPTSKGSTLTLFDSSSSSEFSVDVSAQFEPELITDIEWGNDSWMDLDSAHVAAKGTLTLSALAQYKFTTSGSVSKEFELFSRKWLSIYAVGYVPVYQIVTLSVDVTTSASASVAVTAEAKAILAETVEVGARYNGNSWTPYIIHNEQESLTASLDIAGSVNAEIRIVPKIEVSFYTVLNSTLTIEPILMSQLNIGETTNNTDFLQAHPDRLVQLTTFDANLGMEANVAVDFETYSDVWDVLAPTCVLGSEHCTYTFERMPLFSVPEPTLSQTGLTDDGIALFLTVEDGLANEFDPESISWEVFPADGVVTPVSCSKNEKTTTCAAFFSFGNEDQYTVFASGYGILGEKARQYREIIPRATGCEIRGIAGSPVVIANGLEWERCPIDKTYTVPGAEAYCQKLVLNGHDDWHWPSPAELKSLVYCSSGKETPLLSWIDDCDYPVTMDEATCCITGANRKCIDYNDYTWPTIDSAFRLPESWDGGYTYYTSEMVPENDCSGYDFQTVVDFYSGMSWATWIPNLDEPDTGYLIMCVRSTE